MPRADDINSTEKLLNVIRKRKSELPFIPSSQQEPSSSKSVKGRSKRIISLQKNINVGIDIGLANIRIVKTQKISENAYRVLEYTNIPYPSTLSKGTQEFADLLKKAIQQFCGSHTKYNLWAVMSAANIEVRHIRIPKVPKKQIENAVYWTFKKESPFDDNENIFDFEIQEELIDQGVPKYAVMVYTAPRQEVEEIKRLFQRIGLSLSGISSTPFAIQNIFRTKWIEIPDEVIASLFIGNDFSRIDIFAKGNLVMTRGIKAGTNSMLEALSEAIQNEADATEISTDRLPISREQARKILFSLSPDSPALTGQDAGYGLKEDQIFDIILPALDRLVRQIERTFEYYTVTLGNEKINKIYLSGVMDIYMPLVDYVGNQLGMDREILDPLGLQGSFLSRSGMPEEINISARAAYVPALGLALSDNLHTPNLSFTYKDKEHDAKVGWINRSIIFGFVTFFLLCGAVLSYQIHGASQKKMVLAQVQRQFAQYNPRIDRNAVIAQVDSNRQEQQSIKLYAERYLGIAVISELSRTTSPHIHLIDLKITLNKQALTAPQTIKNEGAVGPDKALKDEWGSLIVEGVISGDKKNFEASLAQYMMKLDASPLFHRIVLEKSFSRKVKTGEVMQFTLSAKIG